MPKRRKFIEQDLSDLDYGPIYNDPPPKFNEQDLSDLSDLDYGPIYNDPPQPVVSLPRRRVRRRVAARRSTGQPGPLTESAARPAGVISSIPAAVLQTPDADGDPSNAPAPLASSSSSGPGRASDSADLTRSSEVTPSSPKRTRLTAAVDAEQALDEVSGASTANDHGQEQLALDNDIAEPAESNSEQRNTDANGKEAKRRGRNTKGFAMSSFKSAREFRETFTDQDKTDAMLEGVQYVTDRTARTRIFRRGLPQLQKDAARLAQRTGRAVMLFVGAPDDTDVIPGIPNDIVYSSPNMRHEDEPEAQALANELEKTWLQGMKTVNEARFVSAIEDMERAEESLAQEQEERFAAEEAFAEYQERVQERLRVVQERERVLLEKLRVRQEKKRLRAEKKERKRARKLLEAGETKEERKARRKTEKEAAAAAANAARYDEDEEQLQ
ncbi:uncharacterized protein JCM15063_001427 [Sporobolomyces koalae]|uniref:uncharacterized protein n=1 Tax=Sporobolomyces koalae TaxID=500713 RepID=UPI003173D287